MVLGCAGLIAGVAATAMDLGFPIHYGLLGILARISVALGLLVPPRSRLTEMKD